MWVKRLTRMKVLPIAMLIAVGLYSAPLLFTFFDRELYSQFLDWGVDGWGAAYARTALFTISSVIVQIFGGFVGAVLLRRISPSVARLTSFLLVPSLIGSVALAFIVKLNLFKYSGLAALVEDRAPVYTWTLMLAVQAWQFMSLSLYLFWLHLQTCPRALGDFAVASRLSPLERVRDLYWPHCYNLAVLLAMFGSLQGLQEVSKFQLILRASPGTGTELAGHRLMRYYHALAPADPIAAVDSTLGYSAVFIVVGIAATLISVTLVACGGTLFFRVVGRVPIRLHVPLTCRNTLAICFVCIVLSPILILRDYAFRHHFVDMQVFVRSVIMSLMVLGVLTPTVFVFGVASRLIWMRMLERFDKRALPYFVVVYLLLFIPPIGLAFCGYRWLAALGNGLQSPSIVFLLWIFSQVVVAFPLLASFVLYNNFRVRTAEIHLQQAAQATIPEIARYSFFSRFRRENALLAIFGFSIIWNEGTLNSVISGLTRTMPSFAIELMNRVEGRSNAYYEAANLILVAFIPIAIALVLWRITTKESEALVVRRSV